MTPRRVDRQLDGAPAVVAHGEGVDRQVARRVWTRRRTLLVVALAGSAVLAVFATQQLLRTTGRSRVARADVAVAEVRRQPFHESIAGVGELLPRTTVFLDTVEGGRIEEIYVEEGGLVQAGQPLLRLSNSDLQLRLVDMDSRRLEQLNRLRDTRYRMQHSDLEFRQSLAEMDYQVQRLERQVGRNERLYESRLISAEEKEQAEAELAFVRRKRALAEETYRQGGLAQQSHLDQMEAEVRSMEESYRILLGLADNLVVEAPVAGQLTALDAEIGRLMPAGSRLGQIDRIADGHKIRAEVDEFHLDRVAAGQRGTTLPLAGKRYGVRVTRVYPEVRENRFTIDLDLVGSQPEGLRRGQTIGFQLELGEPREALVLPKGPFYQSTRGTWVYVLVGDSRAERRPIRLGRMASDSIEVLAGLTAGERVITSSYEPLGNAEVVLLE